MKRIFSILPSHPAFSQRRERVGAGGFVLHYMKVLLLLVASLLAFKANSQNKPVISGNDVTTCFGKQGCIDITTSDADNDSVDIWWDNSIAGGIFTHTSNVKRFATGSVCFTRSGRFYPDTAEQFTVYAT
ncbi:MAG TPA: hypothetical protein VEC12_03720, partial [Bacteroidia bacterium]|nr:hypothetical protein [Bacteroidia bacterium]